MQLVYVHPTSVAEEWFFTSTPSAPNPMKFYENPVVQKIPAQANLEFK